MSFAFMPLYTGDYFRDTRHLSMSEHGAYLLMLAYCWDQKGPLPLDLLRVYGICGAKSKDEQEAVGRVLDDFFVRMEDGYYNSRIQREVERSEAISRSRSEAGRKGYQARAKHLPSKSRANAEQVHLPPSPPPSPQPEEPNKVRRAKAARLPADWVLPKGWGDWALKQQPTWSEEHVRKVALMFFNHWTSTGRNAAKLDWFKTWQNWVLKEPALKGSQPRKPWFLSAAAIEAKGREIGREPPADKARWGEYRDAVLEAAGVTHEMISSAKKDFT
jgi:uncharacterized protein YdaU (DUF1376 family)